jgi:hypothetical protein
MGLPTLVRLARCTSTSLGLMSNAGTCSSIHPMNQRTSQISSPRRSQPGRWPTTARRREALHPQVALAAATDKEHDRPPPAWSLFFETTASG